MYHYDTYESNFYMWCDKMSNTMSELNIDSTSESPPRRSVLATLGGGVIGGLAGCLGDGGDTETPTSGSDETNETPTPESTSSSEVNCGRYTLADIPGEVVHNGADSITVLAHGACEFPTSGADIRVKVQNTGEQTLVPEYASTVAENPLYIVARALSSEGNQLKIADIAGGPGEIQPGTSATLKTRTGVNNDQFAEYELCILTQRLPAGEWENTCGG